MKTPKNLRVNEPTETPPERSVQGVGMPPTDVVEALKECEYALQQVLRNGKVGWLQEEAHKTACAALTAQKQRRHTKQITNS